MFLQAMLLNCSHVFCKFCIDSWKKTKKECPNCRAKITTEARAYVLDNFIEKMADTLSEDMKKCRQQTIAERDGKLYMLIMAFNRKSGFPKTYSIQHINNNYIHHMSQLPD